MSKAPSMPLFCGDYLADTKHLNLEQHGAYLVLLMVTWRNNGKAIQDDPDLIAKYLGCTRDRWLKKIRPTLAPMFDLDDGVWRSPKLEEQWAYVQGSISRKSANGKLGGRPPAAKVAETAPNISAETFNKNAETQTANLLEYKESDKAVGSVSVPSSLSTQPQPLNQLEESKKESPFKPPHGGQVDGVLFPVQEVQNAPQKQKKPRRGKSEPPPVPEEIFQAYWSLNPPPDEANKHRHNEKATRNNLAKAIASGVDAQELIQAWSNYRDKMKYTGKFYTEFIKAAQNFVNLKDREWEKHLVPFSPQKHNGNVTPLRNGTINQPPQAVIRRGGLSF